MLARGLAADFGLARLGLLLVRDAARAARIGQVQFALEETLPALFLAIGSSLVVWPAAGFPLMAKRAGARLVIINREETELDAVADLVVRHDIGTVLAPFIYSQLIWMTLLGYLVFGDLPHEMTIFGAAIIIASGLYILYREQVHGGR